MLRLLVPFCLWLLLAPPPEGGRQSLSHRAVNHSALIGVTMSLYAFPVAGEQIEIAVELSRPSSLWFWPALDGWHVGNLACAVARPVRSPCGLGSRVGASAITIALGTVVTVNSVYGPMYRGAELGLAGDRVFIRTDDRQRNWRTFRLGGTHQAVVTAMPRTAAAWARQLLSVDRSIATNDAEHQCAIELLEFELQQQSVVDALSREEDLCVVYSPALLQRFDRGQAAANPPILQRVSSFDNSDASSSSERDGSSAIILHMQPVPSLTWLGTPRPRGCSAGTSPRSRIDLDLSRFQSRAFLARRACRAAFCAAPERR